MSNNYDKTNTGAVAVRQDFGGQELDIAGETAAAAVVAREKAMVEARFIMAMRRPRDHEDVRQRLLKECKRPNFAAVAKYRKPVGEGIVGPSIRFAEAALRCMTNILAETVVVYDDERKRIVRVSVMDLESNITYPVDVTISKTVERKNPAGRVVVSERLNSDGKTVYEVLATDDEILNKQNALISKALRTSGLRLLPGDIFDEAMRQIDETKRGEVKKDPDAEKRRVIDAFSEVGVSAIDLQAYLGHTLDRMTPAEILELREVFAAIREGESTWDAVMEGRGDRTVGGREQQEEIAARKIAELQKQKAATKSADAAAATGEVEPPTAENPKTQADLKPPVSPAGLRTVPVFGKKS